MNQVFTGFSPAVREFYIELNNNNNREWYLNNKHIYEREIKEKAQDLVSDLANRFISLGLPFIADKKKAIMRPYRGIRFSKDKHPYKTNLGVFFPFSLLDKQGKPVEILGLYFHIDTNETFVAGGLKSPLPQALKLIREHISDEWKELDGLVTSKGFNSAFSSVLSGERLTRVPRGYEPDHPGAEYLKLKEFIVYSPLKFEELYTSSLIDIIESKAKAIVPFLDFFRPPLEEL